MKASARRPPQKSLSPELPPATAATSLTAASKLRTRQAILAAATEIAALGRAPTVAEAAERAGVSRATAYRHFPSREFLIVELALPVQELRTALAQAGRMNPERRIAAMVRTIAAWVYDHQLALREMLRASLVTGEAGGGYQRPNTRIEMIAHQMEPLRALLSAAEFRRLSMALSLLVGIEPVVVLQDLAGLSREETIETLVWTATRLTESALQKARK